MSCPGSEWMTMENAGIIDNQSSYVTLMGSPSCFQSTCYYTRHLFTHLYNFAIPLTATINGIEATITHTSGNTNSATDSSVRMMKTNISPVGQNKAVSTAWPLGSSTVVYGSNSDLWGTTWTPAEINDVDFGVWFSIYNMSAIATTPGVDGIELEIFYTTASGVVESQSSSAFRGRVSWNGSSFVALLGKETVNVAIYDLTGKIIVSNSNVSNGQTLTVNEIQNGLYIYKISRNGQERSGKVFVTR